MNRSFLIFSIKEIIKHRHYYTWDETRHPYSNYFDEVFTILPLEDQRTLKNYYKSFFENFGVSITQAEKYLWLSRLNPRKKFMLETKTLTKFGYSEIKKIPLKLKEMDNYLRTIKIWLNKKIRFMCDENELDFRELEETLPKER